MRLLMLAAPGAGKGTQAERLAQAYGIDHISTGEMLRAEAAAGTGIGREARAYLDRGDLVPDELLMDMVTARVLEAAGGNGYVLDGFPRTLAQAEAAYSMVSAIHGVTLQAVLHLAVRPEELRARMRARAAAQGRRDDTATTIEHRLEVFQAQTEPLLGYYGSRGILHTIDGEQGPDQVTADIVALLEGLGVA